MTEQGSALKTESDQVVTQCTHVDYITKVLWYYEINNEYEHVARDYVEWGTNKSNND